LRSSEGLTDEPVLPKKQKIPRRINDGADPHHFRTPAEMYRQQYLLVLDEVVNKIGLIKKI